MGHSKPGLPQRARPKAAPVAQLPTTATSGKATKPQRPDGNWTTKPKTDVGVYWWRAQPGMNAVRVRIHWFASFDITKGILIQADANRGYFVAPDEMQGQWWSKSVQSNDELPPPNDAPVVDE